MLCWLRDGELEPYGEEAAPLPFFAEGRPRAVTTAGEVMSFPVITVEPSATVDEALDCMRRRAVQHLPVVEEGRLMGLVSDRDLLARQGATDLPVQSIMARRLLTARAESKLWSVAKIMLQGRVHCVLIVDARGTLEGILTSLDLLKCMAHQAPIDVWL